MVGEETSLYNCLRTECGGYPVPKHGWYTNFLVIWLKWCSVDQSLPNDKYDIHVYLHLLDLWPIFSSPSQTNDVYYFDLSSCIRLLISFIISSSVLLAKFFHCYFGHLTNPQENLRFQNSILGDIPKPFSMTLAALDKAIIIRGSENGD